VAFLIRALDSEVETVGFRCGEAALDVATRTLRPRILTF
jgi:hypothetical protein